MSRNYYSEINLHITWHTKASSPLLTPHVEAVVHPYLRGRCNNTPGVFIHEIGGIETYVHLCVSVPPTLLIGDFIGQLKRQPAVQRRAEYRSVERPMNGPGWCGAPINPP